MSQNKVKVTQIDHVELYVPDRHEAAKWYERVLGLHVVPEFEEWAVHPGGPLMIATESGDTKLALFAGAAGTERKTGGWHRVAFRVDGAAFVELLTQIDEIGLTNHEGRPVTKDDSVDHGKAFSVYFCDPYGHRLEVTTYEHDFVRKKLQS